MEKGAWRVGPALSVSEPEPIRDPFDASWRERIFVLGLATVVLNAILVFGLALYRDAGRVPELLGLIPASALFAGKFLPLWSASGKSSFSPWELGTVIWVMDTATVVLIVYSIEGLEAVRWIRSGLARLRKNARLVVAAYPRIRKAAVVGVVAFVLFPVAGTGALAGSFLGILLGLHRWMVIAAVSAGGLLGGMAMAFAALHFGEALASLEAAQGDPVVRYALMGGVLSLIVGCLVVFNRLYQRALAQAEVAEQADAGALGAEFERPGAAAPVGKV